MMASCVKCGGLIVLEQILDFYRMSGWRCVNCGWNRGDIQWSPTVERREMKRGHPSECSQYKEKVNEAQ